MNRKTTLHERAWSNPYTYWYDLNLIWFDLIWIWFDLIWFDLIWFDLIWLDLIWFDLIRLYCPVFPLSLQKWKWGGESLVILDKSLVGGKVPNCITSQLAQLKILLLLYILFQLIKTLPNIKCMWTPLDGMRESSIFSNSFFKYNSDNLPGLNSVPASSTHYWTWFIQPLNNFYRAALGYMWNMTKHFEQFFRFNFISFMAQQRRVLFPLTVHTLKTEHLFEWVQLLTSIQSKVIK